MPGCSGFPRYVQGLELRGLDVRGFGGVYFSIFECRCFGCSLGVGMSKGISGFTGLSACRRFPRDTGGVWGLCSALLFWVGVMKAREVNMHKGFPDFPDFFRSV